MTRSLNRLSAVAVKRASPGKYADGGGLWLHKRQDGGGQWFLRVTVHGRRREMGLGSIAEVTLKEARDTAAKARAVVRAGGDPIKERQKERRAKQRNLHLLGEVAADAFKAQKANLKADGKAGRWYSPLEIHVLPKLGKVPVADIDQIDIRDTLAPIWRDKAATAEKALQRLSIVMRHAAALGYDVDLQACLKAKALLGGQSREVEHIPALHWRDVPAFYASLSDGTVAHLALRLLILTGVRSNPLRYLREEHISDDVWTIPAALMKARKGKATNFRVPLSPAAMEAVHEARRQVRDGYIFPSVRKGVISDATMARLMERRGMEARPHGFRSSLRDWLAEATDAPREIAETILGHAAGGKVELSYRRTDYLEQRRTLLQRWADHVTGKSGKVIELVKAS